jgi:hypothetical protein
MQYAAPKLQHLKNLEILFAVKWAQQKTGWDIPYLDFMGSQAGLLLGE